MILVQAILVPHLRSLLQIISWYYKGIVS